jgi:hypothetical protein
MCVHVQGVAQERIVWFTAGGGRLPWCGAVDDIDRQQGPEAEQRPSEKQCGYDAEYRQRDMPSEITISR